MALANAIQGARHVAQQITWSDEDGNAVDLSGATLSGYKRSLSSNTTVALDGTLTPDPDQVANKGVFTWTYGVVDVGTPGNFMVQFVATYGAGDEDKTFETAWTVYNALDDEV